MTVVIRAHGHPRITASHAKTFELSTDDDIGREATCVIGVRATADWNALGRVMGPVALVIEAGGHKQSVAAEASPFWSRGHGLVVRKSYFRGDDTLAVSSDTAAAELDRALVAALADGAEVTVTVRPLGPPAPAVLFTDRLEPRVPDGLRIVGLPVGAVEVEGDVLTRPGAALAACQAVAGLSGDLLLLGPPVSARRLAAARVAAPAVGLVTAGKAVPEATASVVFRPGEVVAPVLAGPPTQRVNASDRVFSVVPGQMDAFFDALRAEGVSDRILRAAARRARPQ